MHKLLVSAMFAGAVAFSASPKSIDKSRLSKSEIDQMNAEAEKYVKERAEFLVPELESGSEKSAPVVVRGEKESKGASGVKEHEEAEPRSSFGLAAAAAPVVISSAKTYQFSVVAITFNHGSEVGSVDKWEPTKLLKDGAKPDFVFVTFQEAGHDGGLGAMIAGMARLSYTWIDWKADYGTSVGLFYNANSQALQNKILTVRTAYAPGGTDTVASASWGYGKVVERIRIRVSEKCGKAIGDLQMMGTHMTSNEGKFWERYSMWKDAWTNAKNWAAATHVPTATVMAGDMNWRMAYGEWSDADAPQTMRHNTCGSSSHHLEEFLCWAQPHGQVNDMRIMIHEAPVKFQPTYKRVREGQEMDCTKAADFQPGDLDGLSDWETTLEQRQFAHKAKLSCYKSGDTSRTPSWTDRVMFYPFGASAISTRYYTDFYRGEHGSSEADHQMVVWAGDIGLECAACTRLITVTVTPTIWANEIGVQIDGTTVWQTGSLTTNYREETKTIKIAPGAHTVLLTDSYNDGWHGGSIEFHDGAHVLARFVTGSYERWPSRSYELVVPEPTTCA